jgi:DNA primase
MIDYASLKRAVPLRDILAAYDVRNLRSVGSEALIGPCPLHGGDNPTAFRVQLERGLWHCFTRCGGGDTLDLVARLEGTSVYQAGLALQRMASLCAPLVAREESPSALPELPFRLTLEPHPYLTRERGLSTATCSHFGVGRCRRGLLAGRIAIPIHDEHGRLVAYAGRSLDARPDKYRFPRGFPKGRVLFNAWRQAENEELIVVEGFFDVLRLHQHGHPEAVALMGSTASPSQLDWLVSSGKRLVLLLDGDEAGQRGQALLAASLARVGHPHRALHLPKGAQPDMLSGQDISYLLS